MRERKKRLSEEGGEPLDTEEQYSIIYGLTRSNSFSNLLFASLFALISLVGVVSKVTFFVYEYVEPFRLPQYLLLLDSADHTLLLFFESLSLFCHTLMLVAWVFKGTDVYTLYTKSGDANLLSAKEKLQVNERTQRVSRNVFILCSIVSAVCTVVMLLLTEQIVGSFLVIGVTAVISLFSWYSLNQIHESEKEATNLYQSTYEFKKI